ncbi:hypothetical protein GCM10022221_64040 [Actinocorallia aurea]
MSERGFAGTPVSVVCREAGVPAPSVYWYFGSKDGLLAAVMERGAAWWFAGLPAWESLEGTAEERMRALLAAGAAALGGLLTWAGDWRWSLLVNVPVGLALIAVALKALGLRDPETRRRPLGLPSALLVTAALTSAVYGLVHAAEKGWGDPWTIGALVCDAGVQVVSGTRTTADGFEETFAVNHLAHFALVRLLLPWTCRRAARSEPGSPGLSGRLWARVRTGWAGRTGSVGGVSVRSGAKYAFSLMCGWAGGMKIFPVGFVGSRPSTPGRRGLVGGPMDYQLLGPLRMGGAEPRTISAPKVEALFAALLIRANQPVSTDELIDELWGDGPPRRARAALHVYISQLRKNVLPPGGAEIHTHAQRYVLAVDETLVDSHHLQRLHAQGVSALRDDPERALAGFTAAAALFRGPVLSGVPQGLIVGTFARWAEEVRLECLEAIAQCSLRTGRHRELIRDLSRWVEEHPLNETFREQLMLALHRSGRRAEALEAFQAARRVLRDELGLDPRHTMRRLQSAIMEADPDLLAVAG